MFFSSTNIMPIIGGRRRKGLRTRKPPVKTRKAKLLKTIKGVVARNTQLNYGDTLINEAPSWSGGTAVDLTASIVQGTLYNNRIGDMIQVKSIQMKCNVNTADNYNVLRIIFFQWYGDSAVHFPAITDLLTASQLGVSAAPFATYDRSGVNKTFKVLADRTYLVDTYNSNKRAYINLSKFKRTGYNLGANTGSNHIFYITISDSGVVPHPALVGYQRMNYIE